MKYYLIPLLATALTLFGSPASANHQPSSRADHSIWLGSHGSLSGWRPISRDELIVWASPKQPYLVKIWRTSHGLRFVHRIGLTRSGGRVTKFDRVIVDGERVPIKSIQRLDPDTAKNLRYRS